MSSLRESVPPTYTAHKACESCSVFGPTVIWLQHATIMQTLFQHVSRQVDSQAEEREGDDSVIPLKR